PAAGTAGWHKVCLRIPRKRTSLHENGSSDDVWSTIGSGETWQGEFQNGCKGGEKRWVDVTIWPIKNVLGRPWRYAALLEDIHEHRRIRQELELQRSRMNHAFEAANDGIYDVGLSRIEAYFSPRFYTMLGYQADELGTTSEAIVALLHPEDAAGFRTTMERVFEGEQGRFDLEFRLRTKDGAWFWVRSRGKIVEYDEDGKPRRLVGTHADINEHKQFERELEEQKRKAEAANMAKSRFLANMSHELRTPLNSILGFTRQMDRDPSFPREHRHSLSIVNRSGEHLLELINDVLEMTKIEVGGMTVSPSLICTGCSRRWS
ncbi:MAG: PAS domain-containing sensor histidine kinase, partial [Myxococcota bacterium]